MRVSLHSLPWFTGTNSQVKVDAFQHSLDACDDNHPVFGGHRACDFTLHCHVVLLLRFVIAAMLRFNLCKMFFVTTFYFLHFIVVFSH